MINLATTFVVGAGGSEPYGLPVSADLSRQTRSLSPHDVVYQLLYCVLKSTEQLETLIADLKRHPAASVDAFLEHRQHQPDTMRGAKALLAAVLGHSIADLGASIRESQGDWIRRVITTMSRGATRAKDFARAASNVTFVTFNFDSIIEEHSSALIKKIYHGDPAEDIGDAIRAIRVLHVHGQLPTFPSDRLYVPNTRADGYTATGISGRWIAWVSAASESIRIVLDDIHPDLLSAARTAIQESRVVCFMGFSYDLTNLAKLDVPHVFTTGTTPYVFGSAFGLSTGERERIGDFFRPVQIALGDKGCKCLDVLDAFHVLREF